MSRVCAQDDWNDGPEKTLMFLEGWSLRAFDSSQMKSRTTHKYIIMQLVNSDEIVTRSRTAKREEAHCSPDFNANLHNQDETTHRQSRRDAARSTMSD